MCRPDDADRVCTAHCTAKSNDLLIHPDGTIVGSDQHALHCHLEPDSDPRAIVSSDRAAGTEITRRA